MEIKDLIPLTNENGKNFLRFTHAEILGTEENPSLSDKFFVIVKYSDGTKAVWSLPKKHSTSGACSFGELEYFAMVWAYEKIGAKILWMYNGYPVRPIWRNDMTLQQKKSWMENEVYILEKYS